MTMVCKKCGSENVTVQAVAEQKKRGCLASILWIILTLLTCGLIILIPLLIRKGSKVKSYAVCQDCGYRWKV
nr:MAG TPA: RNA polymerase-like protein [Caudoviricetes sp.]